MKLDVNFHETKNLKLSRKNQQLKLRQTDFIKKNCFCTFLFFSFKISCSSSLQLSLLYFLPNFLPSFLNWNKLTIKELNGP